MANSSVPGSLIWDPNDCSGFSSMPVLPNNTDSGHVCAMQTQNETAMQACCDGEIMTYTCWKYCATDQYVSRFGDCLSEQMNITDPPYGLYCMGNTTGTIRETVTSFGVRRPKAPSIGVTLLLACFLAFFLTPASAAIVPSLAERSVVKRDVGKFTFNEDRTFTQLGRSRKVTANFAGGISAFGSEVDTGIMNNNRTINGTSAADAKYDDFFDMLSEIYGRQFPAMSSVETEIQVAKPSGQTVFVTWTPFHWCVNGTVTGAGDVLDGFDGEMPILACGPVFVSDGNSSSSWDAESMEGAMIQGSFSKVVLG
ncbi:hypothetical protein KC363_g6992 [Hortaea werneckii]|uniref:Uncharacterized protein n=1 Tax=Hortaea werneckii TaxID=91943 RepID=A0A3M7FN56_HORWE|nr:hypothetical protein KC363_g6992 [Hortaea werneckii]RMY90329.1 hypothetical protein D0861_03698 [Hortaea werneckii]